MIVNGIPQEGRNFLEKAHTADCNFGLSPGASSSPALVLSTFHLVLQLMVYKEYSVVQDVLDPR